MPRVYQTIRGVPLAKTGDWPVYRGNGRITREDLADVVAAAQDTEVREALDGDPRGWLGHIDGADAAQARHDEPAIGRVTNLRLDDAGDTLIGDVEDVPEGVPEHYPRRSVELHPNITTSTGRRYRKVLTGLAYLGRRRGAIRGLGALDDIARGQRPTLAALRWEGEPTLCALPDEQADERTDPNGPAGSLDDASGGDTVGGMTSATAAPTKAPKKSGDAEGAPENKTETTDDVETPPENQPDPAGNTPDGDDTPPAGGAGTPSADGPVTVTVTKAVYDGLVSRLDKLERKDKERTEADETTERETAIAAALADGRIAPADKESTVSYFAAHGNAAGLDLLKRLPKGKTPVGEIGANAADDEQINASEFAADEPLPDHLSIVPRRKRRDRKES